VIDLYERCGSKIEKMGWKCRTRGRAHQRGVAKPAKGASEVARVSGDSRLEKRITLLTNTGT
jgi:hypothetical protein